MKVRVLVEKEVEADVSLDDVMAEIAGLPDPESNGELLRLLNLCVTTVKRVPADLIAKMTDAHRKVVVDALRCEVERFASVAVASASPDSVQLTIHAAPVQPVSAHVAYAAEAISKNIC